MKKILIVPVFWKRTKHFGFAFGVVLLLLTTALNCEDDAVLSPARLEIAPAELDFGENNNSLAFAIKNTGQQNLTWTVSESVDWIVNFQNTTGKITGTGESQITVTIDRDRLSPGDNTGSIQVTAAADDGSALEGGAKNVTVKVQKPSPPALSMSSNDISGLGSANVVAKALIDNLGSGNISQHGHVWHTSPNPDLSDGSISKSSLGEKTETGKFSSPLTNLNANTSYYIRAYAINSSGTSYSNEVSFSTPGDGSMNNSRVLINNANISENEPVGTEIGILSVEDDDEVDTHTYSLVFGTGDTDNSHFSIEGNRLKAAAAFDYETKNSYSIRVRARDSEIIIDEILSINVINVWDPRWTQATASAAWTARTIHTSVVFDNKIWVMGGWDGSSRNDVWSSSNGSTWTQVDASADWTERSNHTSVVFDNKIWVMGGNDVNCRNDVWSSSNGSSWTQVDASADWTERSNHTSVVFDNKIWVMGGYDGNILNDVWSSSNGSTWTQVNTSADWTGREVHTSVVFDNKIWIMGGRILIGTGRTAITYADDVWSSYNGGAWTQTKTIASAGWLGRWTPTSVVFDNKIWVMGGFGSNRLTMKMTFGLPQMVARGHRSTLPQIGQKEVFTLP